jgi:hypothetical protein
LARRFLALASVTVLAGWTVPTLAGACQNVGFTLNPTSAGPGDTVNFTISGIDSGAGYTIWVNGAPWQSGTNTNGGPGYSGTFPMPNEGASPQSIDIHVEIDHPQDGTDRLPAWTPESRTYPYTGLSASQAPANPPLNQSAQPTQGHPSSPNSSPGAGGTDPSHSGPAGLGGGSAQGGDGASGGGGGSASGGFGSGDGFGSGGGETATDQLPAFGSRVRHAAEARNSFRGSATVNGAKPASVPGSARQANIASPTSYPVNRALGISTAALAALALVLLLGGGAAGVLVLRRRRRGPDPGYSPPLTVSLPQMAEMRDALIEAELQELIAEERARRLIPELEPDTEARPPKLPSYA